MAETMKLKAVITAAGPGQQHLLHQTLATADSGRTTIGDFLLELLADAVDEIAIVVPAAQTPRFQSLFAASGRRITFIEQSEPRGYAHAISLARDFVANSPVLHLVGDHLSLSRTAVRCARQLVAVASAENCTVSAVQATRESQLPAYGAIGGKRLPNRVDLYAVDAVAEKPTPTEAEQTLLAPGLRAGHYLCYFGMHVLTTPVLDILDAQLAASDGPVTLSGALAELARRSRYLAFEIAGSRFDIGVRYGLLNAQLALALQGRDRAEVLAGLVELLAR